ncbi:MAG: hypothetical protein K0R75_217 [Paenibacillaceae bacterium]|nr:hypothetical protein [Paenibacillaceae bacterium]
MEAIVDCEDSTLFSWNGTCPESPDGKYLTYIKMAKLSEDLKEPLPAQLWVCRTDLTGHKKLYDFFAHQHNGADQSWIDDRRLVFQGRVEQYSCVFYVIDIFSGKLSYGPVYGRIGHSSRKQKILFGVYKEHDGKNERFPGIGEKGVYEFDCNTGLSRLVISTENMIHYLESRGFQPIEETYNMIHLQYNPSATRIMARWDLQGAMVIISTDLNGNDKIGWMDKTFLHQLWYDDDTYVVFNRLEDVNTIGHYTQDGILIETLAGAANHFDASPDKMWYVSDTAYFKTPIYIHLFRRGVTEPIAVLDEHHFGEPVWKLQAHANPVFSRDGRRVYYMRPVSNDKVQAVYVDITSIINQAI